MIIRKVIIEICVAVAMLLSCANVSGQSIDGIEKTAATDSSLVEKMYVSSNNLYLATDSVCVRPGIVNFPTEKSVLPAKKQNIFQQFVDQLFKGNKDRTFERPIDFSFAVIPSYSREASFGLGGMVTGLFCCQVQEPVQSVWQKICAIMISVVFTVRRWTGMF